MSTSCVSMTMSPNVVSDGVENAPKAEVKSLWEELGWLGCAFMMEVLRV